MIAGAPSSSESKSILLLYVIVISKFLVKRISPIHHIGVVIELVLYHPTVLLILEHESVFVIFESHLALECFL